MPERFGLGEVYLDEEAEAEYLEAFSGYASESPTLADGFERDVARSIALIVQHPKGSPVVRRGIRRRVLHRFKYSLFYAIEPDRIRIVAVAHQHRRPRYWTKRLGS